MKKLLITGGAGFIGSNLIDKLIEIGGFKITCIDNFDPFYDKAIKQKNIAHLIGNPNFSFCELDILDFEKLKSNLSGDYDVIVHLAAKAGVGPSIKDPIAYQNVNLIGTQNLLEFARLNKIKQFIFASSSSVYGVNSKLPWSESDKQLQPISPYASSKIAAELLGYTYSYLHDIRFIALRFFTVFGPRQRPDLAIHKFSKMLMNNEAITVYGDGKTGRDYTYVDDIVNGIVSAISYDQSEYEIFNLGNHALVTLNDLILSLELVFETKANIKYLPHQDGDVPVTYANIEKAQKILKYKPSTDLVSGLKKFKTWLGANN
ncbi:MAG: UDP-glucuronate 4-epimerase [Bacteroidetes bacterium]|jgi:UDP-glucuronate 4-epimerase|nr:UDP-glucuronate 4-epimerase [Bacteroidota bacterium]MDF2452261.1 UDP-glucuronate 4-epimerase [Bacteroidota bacterium]